MDYRCLPVLEPPAFACDSHILAEIERRAVQIGGTWRAHVGHY